MERGRTGGGSCLLPCGLTELELSALMDDHHAAAAEENLKLTSSRARLAPVTIPRHSHDGSSSAWDSINRVALAAAAQKEARRRSHDDRGRGERGETAADRLRQAARSSASTAGRVSPATPSSLDAGTTAQAWTQHTERMQEAKSRSRSDHHLRRMRAESPMVATSRPDSSI